MFRIENLQKRYGEIRAVDGVSFEVREGEIYGLLGPNGAGKTTTLSMMSGLLRPDEGRILFDEYIYLFQAAGMVLLVAMVGAIVLTHRQRKGVKKQVIGDQLARTVEDSVELVKVETGKGI